MKKHKISENVKFNFTRHWLELEKQWFDNSGDSTMSWLDSELTWNILDSSDSSGDYKRGPGGAMAPQSFAWLPVCPPRFFLISLLRSFGWHVQGCPMRFVKTPAILSTAPDLSCVVIRKRHRVNRDNMYCLATINTLPHILADSLHFGVCVTWQSHQGLRQQQQTNFAEETVLTRFTAKVIMIWEILH